ELERRLEHVRLAVDRRSERPRRLDREPLARPLLPVARQPAGRRVDVEPPVVEPLALADREQAQLVRVAGGEQDARAHGPAVELRPDAPTLAEAEPERAGAGEHFAPPAVPFPAVDKRRVEPERDVVQEAPFADPPDIDVPLVALEGVERGNR